MFIIIFKQNLLKIENSMSFKKHQMGLVIFNKLMSPIIKAIVK